MRVPVKVKFIPKDIYKLDEIGRSGNASNGHSQDWQYCLDKAIEEFIKKYEKVGECEEK